MTCIQTSCPLEKGKWERGIGGAERKIKRKKSLFISFAGEAGYAYERGMCEEQSDNFGPHQPELVKIS